MTELPRELHQKAVDAWLALVAQVPDDTWEAPTPCTDWSVRELVNHVTYEELWAAELFGGATLADVGTRFDGDVLGDDPLASARSAAGADTAALAGTSLETVGLSFGETPVDEYAAQLTADHLVHGWDLAAATGQDRTLPPDLVAAVAAWFAEREEMYRAGGAIGPRAETTGQPQDDLLAAFGRRADWSPSPAG